MSGIERIAAERGRQVAEEGWSEEHDDEHDQGELAIAAACYALAPERVHVPQQLNSSRGIDPNTYSYHYSRPEPGQVTWPWAVKWYKRSENRIRDLEKAGALIAAEIDRLQRQTNETPPARKGRRG